MTNRRTELRDDNAATRGALGITAVERGATADDVYTMLGDPAVTGEELPFPKHLTGEELQYLKTMDEMDLVVFNSQDWDRLGESHHPNIRVHWPDGHYTDGLERHLEDIKFNFIWAPDMQIISHPIRVAKGNLTAVTGVAKGTFSRPMPDGKGGFIQPTGKEFAMNMMTVGIWNKQGTMDEEYLFYDNMALFQQMGLA